MSWSAGPGSPVSFVCWRGRQDWRTKAAHRNVYAVTLTGRTRPYKAAYGSALGLRSTLMSREYRCECGHVGWSYHVDLLRLARAEIGLTGDV